jgi:hypothetical protein
LANAPGNDELGGKELHTFLLRLVLFPPGQLLKGELVDLDGTHGGSFATWEELAPAIRRWLATRPGRNRDDP